MSMWCAFLTIVLLLQSYTLIELSKFDWASPKSYTEKEILDNIQPIFKCCGWKSSSDWDEWKIGKMPSWAMPKSCCRPSASSNDSDYCSAKAAYEIGCETKWRARISASIVDLALCWLSAGSALFVLIRILTRVPSDGREIAIPLQDCREIGQPGGAQPNQLVVRVVSATDERRAERNRREPAAGSKRLGHAPCLVITTKKY
jgi:hypothetical protein